MKNLSDIWFFHYLGQKQEKPMFSGKKQSN